MSILKSQKKNLISLKEAREMNLKEKFSRGLSSPTKTMKFFCGALIFGIIFFVLASFIFPKKINYQETPVGTTASLSQQIKFTLSKCSYNPQSKYLEAIFDIDAPISLVQQNYVVECHSSQKPIKTLDSNFFLAGLSTMIVQIHNLPKNFSYVLIKIQIGSEESDMETSINQENIKFICSKKGIATDFDLSEKTDKEYRITSIQNELKTAQNNIAEQKEKIAENDKKSESLQEEIKKLEAEKTYETDDEIEETNEVISSKQKEITTLQQDSEKCQEAIKNYQNKINKLEEKLTELQGNTS